MFEKILDWLTHRYRWFYDFRLNYCKRNHGWTERKLLDGGVYWDRSECTKCGFWEDCS